MEGGGGGSGAAASAEVEPVRGVEEEEEEGGGGGGEAPRCRFWGWGAGTDGQLGVGAAADQLSPRPVRLPRASSFTVSHVACGGAHAIALTGDGSVLTWGRGTCGQLGYGEIGNCLEPQPVEFLKYFTISHVSAGWNHSGFVTDTGHLFTCGDGSFGQLGHGDRQSYSSPREVTFFASKHVTQIACGMRHSLALVKDPSGDVVFGFGSGRHGQLGITADGTSRLFNLPKVVHDFENVPIVAICANGDHSAALTANGQLYTWGRGFNGRSAAYVPQIVSSLKISQVALGWNHALALAEHGELYMIGGYHHGMLGDSQHVRLQQQQQQQAASSNTSLDETFTLPVLRSVSHLDGKKVVHVAAGAEHSAMVTEDGAIMTWGWGEHGQLGLGDTLDQTAPQVVNICETRSSVPTKFKVYCGSGFTFAFLVHEC